MPLYSLVQRTDPRNKPESSKKPEDVREEKQTTRLEDYANPIVNEHEQSQTINNENASYKESELDNSDQQTAVENSTVPISETDQSDIIEGDDSVGDQNTIVNP